MSHQLFSQSFFSLFLAENPRGCLQEGRSRGAQLGRLPCPLESLTGDGCHFVCKFLFRASSSYGGKQKENSGVVVRVGDISYTRVYGGVKPCPEIVTTVGFDWFTLCDWRLLKSRSKHK